MSYNYYSILINQDGEKMIVAKKSGRGRILNIGAVVDNLENYKKYGGRPGNRELCDLLEELGYVPIGIKIEHNGLVYCGIPRHLVAMRLAEMYCYFQEEEFTNLITGRNPGERERTLVLEQPRRRFLILPKRLGHCDLTDYEPYFSHQGLGSLHWDKKKEKKWDDGDKDSEPFYLIYSGEFKLDEPFWSKSKGFKSLFERVGFNEDYVGYAPNTLSEVIPRLQKLICETDHEFVLLRRFEMGSCWDNAYEVRINSN